MKYIIKERKSRIPGFRLLSLRFRFKDSTWDYSLNIKIKEGSFNSSDKRIKNDLVNTIRLHNILDLVDRTKLSMFSEGYGYIPKDEYKKRLLTALTEKGLIYVEQNEDIGNRVLHLSDYIDEYAISRQKSFLMKSSTGTTYKRLGSKIKEFDKSWDISTTDQIKLKSFRHFLISKGLSIPTINLMLVRLKTVLKNYSQYDGELPSKVITSPHFEKLREVKQKRVYITLEELSRIYNMEINDPKLSKARDLLLIGCYTALRVSDWEIKPTDISDDKTLLTYRTRKTGKEVSIPLFPELKVVLERNGWRSPILKENQITDLFRQLCKKAGINRAFKTYLVYPDRTEEKIGQAWEFVTSHTCRRSFATNMYLEEMPVSQIRVFTGHANDKVFMNYVQASDTEISRQVKLNALKKVFNNEKHRPN